MVYVYVLLLNHVENQIPVDTLTTCIHIQNKVYTLWWYSLIISAFNQFKQFKYWGVEFKVKMCKISSGLHNWLSEFCLKVFMSVLSDLLRGFGFDGIWALMSVHMTCLSLWWWHNVFIYYMSSHVLAGSRPALPNKPSTCHSQAAADRLLAWDATTDNMLHRKLTPTGQCFTAWFRA